MSPLCDCERFVQRCGEVDAVWTNDCVLACAAEALVGTTLPCRHRRGEQGGVEPFVSSTVDLLDVMHLAADVGTVLVTAAETDGIGAAQCRRYRYARLIDNRSSQSPATDEG